MANARSKKLIHGVGVNDSKDKVVERINVDGRLVKIWECPVYRVWADMLARCYSRKSKSRHPTYENCTVDDKWHLFSEFKSWMLAQEWEGMAIDKDILSSGIKIYGPENCVFVSKKLNNFTTDRLNDRGEWPVGVNWNKASNKFESRCCNPFTSKRDHLGFFDTPQEAHEAWRKKKHDHACRYADMQKDQRVAQALRTRYANAEKLISAP